MTKEITYEIDRSISPPSCLPRGLDRSRLIDATAMGDNWRTYLDPDTLIVHVGAEYAKLARSQEAMSDMKTNDITLGEQIESVERELAMRRRVYPKWVTIGKIKQETADHELAAMRAVLQTLLDLVEMPPCS